MPGHWSPRRSPNALPEACGSLKATPPSGQAAELQAPAGRETQQNGIYALVVQDGFYHFSLSFKQSKNERSMSAVSSLSLLADGEACLLPGVSAPQDSPGRSPASLHPALLVLILLIHFFLPFVKYGEKGRMNGQSLTGGAGDAPRGPLWKDPRGDKAGEAALGGFARLGLAWPRPTGRRIRYAPSVRPLSPGPRAPALQAGLCLFGAEPGKWGPHALRRGAAWAERQARESWSRNSQDTELGLDGGPLNY